MTETFPPMGRGVLWLTDHVYTVTARIYCRCGDAAHFTAAWQTVVEKVYDFWAEHNGEDHGATTPLICRTQRRSRSAASPDAPSDATMAASPRQGLEGGDA
jgi:hypothetical protein